MEINTSDSARFSKKRHRQKAMALRRVNKSIRVIMAPIILFTSSELGLAFTSLLDQLEVEATSHEDLATAYSKVIAKKACRLYDAVEQMVSEISP